MDGVLLLDSAGRGGRAAARSRSVDAGLDPIFLISPTTTDERIRRSAELGRGFLYVISRLGVTGARDQLAADAAPLVARVRAHVDAAGRARLRHLDARARRRGRARCADAAVVGSALVKVIAEHGATAGRRPSAPASTCAG